MRFNFKGISNHQANDNAAVTTTVATAADDNELMTLILKN